MTARRRLKKPSIGLLGFAPPEGFFTYRLRSNLRNSGPIHELLVEHFGEQSASKGPDGVAVA